MLYSPLEMVIHLYSPFCELNPCGVFHNRNCGRARMSLTDTIYAILSTTIIGYIPNGEKLRNVMTDPTPLPETKMWVTMVTVYTLDSMWALDLNGLY